MDSGDKVKQDAGGGRGQPIPPELIVYEGNGQLVPFVDPSTPEGAVVMLPDRIDEAAGPMFHDDAVGVVKTLQAQGHNVRAANISHPPHYLSEYGAAEIVSSIVLGVAGNFTYDSILTIATLVRLRVMNALHRSDEAVDEAQVRLSIDELDITEGGAVRLRGLSYSGPVEGIAPTLNGILDTDSNGDASTTGA